MLIRSQKNSLESMVTCYVYLRPDKNNMKLNYLIKFPNQYQIHFKKIQIIISINEQIYNFNLDTSWEFCYIFKN